MKHFVLHIILLIISCTVSAQNYDFKVYNVQEGLPQSNVNCLMQDSKGYLWGGTGGGGVFMFDGITFESFSETEGLAGSIVTSVNEDNEGNIWIATTWGGITKYDGEKFEIFTTANGLISNAIKSIKKTKDGTLYFLASNGITIYKNGKFRSVKHNKKDTQFSCLSIIGNSIYVGSNKGLFIYTKDLNLKHQITQKNGLPENIVCNVLKDNNGDIIVGTHSHGIVRIIDGSIDSDKKYIVKPILNQPDLLSKSDVREMTYDDNENIIWLATNNGLFKWNLNQHAFKYFSTLNGLPTNFLNTVYVDRESNVWLGTSGAGLIRFSHPEFMYFDNWPGLGAQDVMAITGNDDFIFCGRGSKGIYSLNKNTFEITKIADLDVRALKIHNNYLYIASQNSGLYRYHLFNKRLELLNPKLAPRALLFYNNKLYVGTYGQGLHIMNLTNFKTLQTYLNENSNLNNNYVHSLINDKKGNIWVGTGDGLCRLKPDGKIIAYPTKYLCNAYIGSISIDRKDNIWFGTDRCVQKYDGVEFTKYTTKNGLNSNTIYFVHFDNKQNFLWVGTNKGLNRVSINSYQQFSIVKHFNQFNGFKGIECNSRAIYQDKSGELWIGTIGGVIAFNPYQYKENTFAPKVNIKSILVHYDSKRLKKYIKNINLRKELPQKITLPYNENIITIKFDGINFRAPEQVEFSYYLKGVENNWRPPTKNREVTYSNLLPGIYTFYLKAKNSDNIWSTPIEITVEITPPFWKSIWFYFILVIFLLYSIYFISTYREKQQKKITQQLEEIVQERTKTILQQRDEKDILLKEIHHRVKNNLQIINSLLSIQSTYTKDKQALKLFEEAKNRIRSMALIHQKMYQTKDLANIDFHEYTKSLLDDLIKIYAIDKKITLDIDIPHIKFGIDTSIPLGLLLNEIISNSLKYAFNNNTPTPTITVKIYKGKGNTFILKVGDNGIGIKREIFDDENLQTLGMELIKIFVQQLDGEIQLDNSNGTIYIITFSEIEKHKNTN